MENVNRYETDKSIRLLMLVKIVATSVEQLKN